MLNAYYLKQMFQTYVCVKSISEGYLLYIYMHIVRSFLLVPFRIKPIYVWHLLLNLVIF